MSPSKTNGNGTSNGNSTPQTLLTSFSANTFSSSAEPLSQSDRDTNQALETSLRSCLFERSASFRDRISPLQFIICDRRLIDRVQWLA